MYIAQPTIYWGWALICRTYTVKACPCNGHNLCGICSPSGRAEDSRSNGPGFKSVYWAKYGAKFQTCGGTLKPGPTHHNKKKLKLLEWGLSNDQRGKTVQLRESAWDQDLKLVPWLLPLSLPFSLPLSLLLPLPFTDPLRLLGSMRSVQKENTPPPPPLPRILCWIMTDTHRLDRATHVKETWASHCDLALYMSSDTNAMFPTIGMNVTSGKNHISTKARNAWTYVYKRHLSDFEYFVKCDEDTFLIIENLKRYMAKRDPEKPEFFGCRLYYTFKGYKFIYHSGGPGIVLSRKSVQIMVERAFSNKTHNCMPDGIG